MSLLPVWRSLALTHWHAALVPFFKCQHIILTEWNGVKFRGLSVGFDSFTILLLLPPRVFLHVYNLSKHTTDGGPVEPIKIGEDMRRNLPALLKLVSHDVPSLSAWRQVVDSERKDNVTNGPRDMSV